MGKVKELDKYRNSKLSNNDSGGGGGMNNYATLKDLKTLEDKLDLRFEMSEKNIKLMFIEEREHQRKNKVDSIKWIVGTGIAVVGLTFTFVRFFIFP